MPGVIIAVAGVFPTASHGGFAMAGNSRPNGFVLDLEPEAGGLEWGALGMQGKQCCPILIATYSNHQKIGPMIEL
jgi:hypothetical protein